MITRVDLHDKNAAYDIYIGRANPSRGLSASKWANPFKMKNESERPKVLEEYTQYITNGAGKHLLNDLHELKDAVLGCWCPPNKRCHGDILMELYERRFYEENKM